jgi:hypothetical protein
MQGNSMTLDRNLRAQSADFLINVESSHCYPNLEDFFKSVCHVLKDDGIFFYADFRFAGSDFQRVQDLIDKHFTVVKYEDIRRGVYQSMLLQN